MTNLASLEPGALRLTLARACAWGLLVAGWVGLGSLSLQFAPTLFLGFALVALWLLALGGAAALATKGALPRWGRAAAILFCALLATAGLLATTHGEGLLALVPSQLAWAAMTALASGVVRTLRRQQAGIPGPPIGAAGLGALVAGLVLGDVGDLSALGLRMAAFMSVIAMVLLLLQRPATGRPATQGCRAGLFDCSLPAWPAGAWRDPVQWPALLAGLAMLPMMTGLPLMASWCRAHFLPAQWIVLLHLGAMFAPAWLLRHSLGHWSPRGLSRVCAALLVAGAICVGWAPAPYDLLGLAVAHGAAWGLAWGGQLWAPARRAQRGSSPWRAAAGYAVLTLAFGAVIEIEGLRGLAAVHIALGLAAALAWAAGTGIEFKASH